MATLKTYALFAGLHYYPNGGWGDFRDFYDGADEAERAGLECLREDCGADWFQVIDLNDGKLVATGRSSSPRGGTHQKRILD